MLEVFDSPVSKNQKSYLEGEDNISLQGTKQGFD